ncbi:MAG: ATP-binding protein [Bacteroidia bacterium]|nr:ATP-binding protein [Bacteroidia bacterium]
MQSPFKFLDSYSKEDQANFFGRAREVEQLNLLFHTSRLLLIYGASGTGKSSLVQAGLLAELSSSDFIPIFIRRQGNINASIHEALRKSLNATETEEIPSMISQLYLEQLCSTVLIVDQLEELWIMGDEQEKESFYHLIQELQDPSIPCSVILIIREEYIGALAEMERILPNVLTNRTRIEQMNYAKLSEVILKTCTHFNMNFEDPDRSISMILENLRGINGNISLHNVQIYLDRLYREDYARTYPAAKEIDPQKPLEITVAEIQKLGSIDNFIKYFLEDQMYDIERELGSTMEKSQSPSVLSLLSQFISKDGLRQEVSDATIDLVVKADGYSREIVNFMLDRLHEASILRKSQNGWELAHDSLAGQIYQMFSLQESRLRVFHNFVKNSLERYHLTGAFLNQGDLDYIFPHIEELSLSSEEEAFIQKSKNSIFSTQEAEIQRIKKVMIQNRKRKWLFWGVSLILMIFSILSMTLWQQAEKYQRMAQEQVELQSDSLQSQQAMIDSLRNLLK